MNRPDQTHERQRREVENECARAGVEIRKSGQALHLIGRGVNLRVTDLRHVLPEDLADINRTHSN
jgi:hypothetical protein